MVNRTELILVFLALAVTGLLAWLVRYWRSAARRGGRGAGLFPQLAARAAASALTFWCLGLALAGTGYVLVHLAPPPLAEPPQLGSRPAPAETPGTAESPSSEPTAPARPQEELEFTEQPALPSGLAEVMAKVESDTGLADSPVLGTGNVVMESVDLAAGKITLLNRSGYAVNLDGWSLLVRAAGPVSDLEGLHLWCEFSPGTVLDPGARLRVLAGQAARASAADERLRGEVRGNRFLWTTDDLPAATAASPASSDRVASSALEVVLYDAEGLVCSTVAAGP